MENNVCPICGGPLRNPQALQDAEICRLCADDLRFLYPYIYLPRVGMLDDHPQCQDLRRKDINYLKKNRTEASAHVSQGKHIPIYRFDPMQLLTLKQFQALLPGADALENQIRLRYDDYTNILEVEYMRSLYCQLGKKGVQNIRRRRTGYAVAGFIKAGAFQEGDMVWILHNGEKIHADILALAEDPLAKDPDWGERRTQGAEDLGNRGNQGHRFRAGYQVTMVLSEAAGIIQNGDWIVTD